jgi:hypothetical protein
MDRRKEEELERMNKLEVRLEIRKDQMAPTFPWWRGDKMF